MIVINDQWGIKNRHRPLISLERLPKGPIVTTHYKCVVLCSHADEDFSKKLELRLCTFCASDVNCETRLTHIN